MEKSTKDITQEEAFNAWKKANKKGTIFARTGFGKMLLAIWAAQEENVSANVIFLAETTQREKDLRDELIKWKYVGPEIKFMCHQSAYKIKGEYFNLVLSDEIDLSLTPVYSLFYFNNTIDNILGLTATIDPRDKVDQNNENSETKLNMLSRIAPVCYRYTVDDSQLDGTGRKLNIYKIYHELDTVDMKAVVVGTKKVPIITSEAEGYKYCDNKFKQAMFIEGTFQSILIRNAAGKRASLLYSLPSKIKEVRKLVSKLKGRTILFGNDIPSLLDITSNVISSKNSNKKNDRIRSDFEKGKIDIVGSFKMLQRGANLPNLDNCVLASYYSTEKGLIQMIGRMRYKDEYGNVFVFVTRGTQEEKWFKNMMYNMTTFNIQEFNSVDECLKQIKI